MRPLPSFALLGGLLTATAVSAQPQTPIYFGDLHVHTSVSEDAYQWGGTRVGPAWACDYARHVANLDFVGIADHGERIEGTATTPGTWQVYTAVIDGKNDETLLDGDGRFVTLIGYEWTSGHDPIPGYGHKNVFFRTEAVPPLCPDAANFDQPGENTEDPDLLWTYLESWKNAHNLTNPPEPANFLCIPHTAAKAVSPTDWSFTHPNQTATEGFSKHGSSEGNQAFFGVEDPMSMFLDRTHQAVLNDWLTNPIDGLRQGIIASSDTHDGMSSGRLPSPLQLYFGPHSVAPNWQTTGGLAAVHASSLTRTDVFDALLARRCYGTSGPRIKLWIETETDLAGPEPLGQELEFTGGSGWIELRVTAQGDTADIGLLELYTGNPGANQSLLVGQLAVTPASPGGTVSASFRWSPAAGDPPLPVADTYFYVVAYQEQTVDYTTNAGVATPVLVNERAWASAAWVKPQ